MCESCELILTLYTLVRKYYCYCAISEILTTSSLLSFISSWLPNVIDGVIQISLIKDDRMGDRFFALWIIEAALNPLQGLLNCLAYGPETFQWLMGRTGWLLRSRQPVNLDTREADPLLR
ncbi:uncharacterized protein LOC144911904 [Branchiostoma floridae x Branchiostoma belcheri]